MAKYSLLAARMEGTMTGNKESERKIPLGEVQAKESLKDPWPEEGDVVRYSETVLDAIDT